VAQLWCRPDGIAVGLWLIVPSRWATADVPSWQERGSGQRLARPLCVPNPVSPTVIPLVRGTLVRVLRWDRVDLGQTVSAHRLPSPPKTC
jgi:hypothetical protein